MSTVVRSVIAMSLLLAFTACDQPVVAAEQQAVLVTGASTGIGREIAETLAGSDGPGHRVRGVR